MQYKDIMNHPLLGPRYKKDLEMNLAACAKASVTSKAPTLASSLN
jgi:hypothetical protein